MLSIGGVTLSCVGSRGGAGGGVPAKRSAGSAIGGAVAVSSVALGALTVRKWRLDNGLEIITIPDAGARAVSYVTAFRVGSRDENAAAGETGLAHLFEHLMFTGTRLADGGGDFDQQIEEAGGSSNAMTSQDFTSYIDEVPPEALDRTIRLEADRMVNLNLEPKQVSNERDVVIQERLGTVEDSVDGLLDEMLWRQSFRAHPYRWPVIGRMEDIKAVTRDKALAFYRRHYAPNRAVVVVAGRFDENTVLASIRAAYGSLPPGSGTPAAVIPPERAPAAEIRADIERPISADRLLIGFPAPALGDGDRAAYDVVGELLAGGPSSRLYRLLVVEREIASSITSDIAPTRDPSLGMFWVQMTQGHAAREAEDTILREIKHLVTQPIAAAELAAAQNRLETQFWLELGSSRGRAESFAEFDVTTGDFRNLVARGAGYARVTVDDVVRVARTYLDSGARSVVVARPKEQPKGQP